MTQPESAARPSDASDASHQPRVTGMRHWLGFLASGTIAFSTDVCIFEVLTMFAGLSPFFARPLSISVAMVCGWLAHRRLTFALTTRPTIKEFLHYAAVAWIAAAVNYVAFSIILLVAPRLDAAVAIFMSSIVAMAVAYLGMRFGVFRQGT